MIKEQQVHTSISQNKEEKNKGEKKNHFFRRVWPKYELKSKQHDLKAIAVYVQTSPKASELILLLKEGSSKMFDGSCWCQRFQAGSDRIYPKVPFDTKKFWQSATFSRNQKEQKKSTAA